MKLKEKDECKACCPAEKGCAVLKVAGARARHILSVLKELLTTRAGAVFKQAKNVKVGGLNANFAVKTAYCIARLESDYVLLSRRRKTPASLLDKLLAKGSLTDTLPTMEQAAQLAQLIEVIDAVSDANLMRHNAALCEMLEKAENGDYAALTAYASGLNTQCPQEAEKAVPPSGQTDTGSASAEQKTDAPKDDSAEYAPAGGITALGGAVLGAAAVSASAKEAGSACENTDEQSGDMRDDYAYFQGTSDSSSYSSCDSSGSGDSGSSGSDSGGSSD